MTNFDVNVLGTFRALDAARRAPLAPPRHLASTGGALIGDALPPVTERSLPKPISPYGASKLAGEGYAYAFAQAYGMCTVALRFANVYGPWSARKAGRDDGVLPGHPCRRADHDLRRRLRVARLYPRRGRLPRDRAQHSDATSLAAPCSGLHPEAPSYRAGRGPLRRARPPHDPVEYRPKPAARSAATSRAMTLPGRSSGMRRRSAARTASPHLAVVPGRRSSPGAENLRTAHAGRACEQPAPVTPDSCGESATR